MDQFFPLLDKVEQEVKEIDDLVDSIGTQAIPAMGGPTPPLVHAYAEEIKLEDKESEKNQLDGKDKEQEKEENSIPELKTGPKSTFEYRSLAIIPTSLSTPSLLSPPSLSNSFLLIPLPEFFLAMIFPIKFSRFPHLSRPRKKTESVHLEVRIVMWVIPRSLR